VAGTLGNEPSASIKFGEFLDCLRYGQLLKQESPPCSNKGSAAILYREHFLTDNLGNWPLCLLQCGRHLPTYRSAHFHCQFVRHPTKLISFIAPVET